jgi:hypothetical protein
MSDEEYHQWQEDQAAAEKAEKEAEEWAVYYAKREEYDRSREEWREEKRRRREDREMSASVVDYPGGGSPRRSQLTYPYRAYVVWLVLCGVISIYLSLAVEYSMFGVQTGTIQVPTFAMLWFVTSVIGIWAIRMWRRARRLSSK